AQILLAKKYGSEPDVSPFKANLSSMLEEADAALIIGDPALRLDPAALRNRYEVLDLGEQWVSYTGLPMVFAVWAGRPPHIYPKLDDLFVQSCRYGLDHLDEILQVECPNRGISQALGREYLTRHIVTNLTARHHEGMRHYMQLAREFETPEKSYD